MRRILYNRMPKEIFILLFVFDISVNSQCNGNYKHTKQNPWNDFTKCNRIFYLSLNLLHLKLGSINLYSIDIKRRSIESKSIEIRNHLTDIRKFWLILNYNKRQR